MDLQSKVASFYWTMTGRAADYIEARERFEEEVEEFLEALDEWALAVEDGDEDAIMEALLHVAKESGDVSFTNAALCDTAGVDYDEAADIVADDNLQNKVPTRGGKVRKKAGYLPPSMKRAVL